MGMEEGVSPEEEMEILSGEREEKKEEDKEEEVKRKKTVLEKEVM